jgi:Undecaprenyl-phosphate glucose phosphotransferase
MTAFVESLPAARIRPAKRVSADVSLGLLQALDVLVLCALGAGLYAALVEARFEEVARGSYLFTCVLAGLLTFVFQKAAARRDLGLAALLRVALGSWCLAAVALLLLSFGLQAGDQFSRLWTGAYFLAGFAYLLASRGWFARRMQALARAGRLSQRVAILGTGPGCAALAERMTARGPGGPRLVGVFRLPSGESRGDLDDLLTACREDQVDVVVLSQPEGLALEADARVRALCHLPVTVLVHLEQLDRLGDARLLRFEGAGMAELARRPLDDGQRLLKRAEDLVVAGALLVLTAPVFALIALAVKLESPGPVFFMQPRYGYNGRLIEVLKFRSMRHDLGDRDGETLTARGDARVTRVGRIIRKLSLDELPQLVNVLRGEMSMVGPRPHPLRAKAGDRLYDEVVEEFYARYRVVPGITGLAQVSGLRGQTDTEQKLIDRVAADLEYIERWSLWLDLKILARTVFKVVEAENAV